MTLPRMKELSVGKQRGPRRRADDHRGGARFGVSRQTIHAWLARYEQAGMEEMGNRSHRPIHSPQQMPALIEVHVLEMRRFKPFWGPRRLVHELAKKGVKPTPSSSAI